MTRKIIIISASIIFLYKPNLIFAQLKSEPVKDTSTWLTNHLHMSIGNKKFYQNDTLHHVNRFLITAISVKDCKIDATVKLTQMSLQKGFADITYTLSYSIPLEEIASIGTENKQDTMATYIGAPLFFKTKENKRVIFYKMIEDHTGRTEAEGYYSEATLWRGGIERPQVLDVLHALRNSCSIK